MGYVNVSAGKQLPDDVNVVIEIPAHSAPVKYEVDKDEDVLRVDRFMGTAMFYPANYGYIPQTLSEDGDPVDALVITPVPLVHGAVIRCRPVGLMRMTDEAGVDNKVLLVPVEKLTPLYSHVKSPDDLPASLLASLVHFFEHYKDLEKGKWVKVNGWFGLDEARQEILNSAKRYQDGLK